MQNTGEIRNPLKQRLSWCGWYLVVELEIVVYRSGSQSNWNRGNFQVFIDEFVVFVHPSRHPPSLNYSTTLLCHDLIFQSQCEYTQQAHQISSENFPMQIDFEIRKWYTTLRSSFQILRSEFSKMDKHTASGDSQRCMKWSNHARYRVWRMRMSKV